MIRAVPEACPVFANRPRVTVIALALVINTADSSPTTKLQVSPAHFLACRHVTATRFGCAIFAHESFVANASVIDALSVSALGPTDFVRAVNTSISSVAFAFFVHANALVVAVGRAVAASAVVPRVTAQTCANAIVTIPMSTAVVRANSPGAISAYEAKVTDAVQVRLL